MLGKMYTVTFSGVAVTAQQDLFEITASADAVVLIHDINVSQLTEVGDAAEENLLLLMKSGQTTSGSGGTTVTAVPIALGDPAFGGVCEANNTTKASVGTIVTHAAWNWNIRQAFEKIYTPEARHGLNPSRRWTLELATTPADSITMAGFITLEEFGG